MKIKVFLSKRLNVVVFVTLIFLILTPLITVVIPNYLFDQRIDSVEERLKELTYQYQEVQELKGSENLYIYDNGTSSLLTSTGYLTVINFEIEEHLIHWSELQLDKFEQNESEVFYQDDFRNEQYVYYIRVLDDEMYVIAFVDTFTIHNFVDSLSFYSLVLIIFVFMATLLLSMTVLSSGLVKKYSLYDPITQLNTKIAFIHFFGKKSNKDKYITYHNLSNLDDILDSCGLRYKPNVLKMVKMNLLSNYSFENIFQLSDSEYIIISADEYIVTNEISEVLNRVIIEDAPVPYNITVKTVKVQKEIMSNISAETLIMRMNYAFSAINNTKQPSITMDAKILEEMDMEVYYQSHLENAIKNNDLINVYQVKVNPKSGIVIGAEALSRWIDKGVMIYPSKYVNLAETTGLIYDLDVLSFQNSCKMIRTLLDRKVINSSFKLSCNFSPITLKNMNIELVKDTIAENNIEAKYLSFEVTESVSLEYEVIKGFLDEVKELGISIEIDDFSAGNSSFTVLPLLNADYVKLDMAILPVNFEDKTEILIYESLVEVSKKLGLKIISEGVENEKQVAFLKGLSVEGIQGYYYSKPIMEDKFIEYLIENKIKSSTNS